MLFLFLLSLALLAAGRYADYLTSRQFPYCGGTEGNSLMRDPHGRFAEKRNLVASVIVGVASVLLYGYLEHMSGIVVNLIIGGGSLVVAYLNNRANKKDREKQLAIVSQIRDLLANTTDHNEINDWFEQNLYQVFDRSFGGWTYLSPFPWLVSQNPDRFVAILECRDMLITFVRTGAVFPK
jgi:hypothetical protein